MDCSSNLKFKCTSCDKSGPATKFETKQKEALSQIENYLDLNNYSKENQNAIKRYQLIANQGINSATTVEQLENIIKEYKDNVDKVKTLAEELEEDKKQKENPPILKIGGNFVTFRRPRSYGPEPGGGGLLPASDRLYDPRCMDSCRQVQESLE